MAPRPPVVVKIRTKIEDIQRRTKERTPPLPFETAWTPPSLSGVAGLTVKGAKLASLVGPRIITARLAQTLDEPLSLTLDIWDKQRKLLTSGLLDTKLRIALDAQGFAMTRVAKAGDMLTLEFEDAKVNALRQFNTPIKVTRGSTTRIQFVQRLLDEKGAPTLRRYIDAGKAGQITVEKNPLALSPVKERKPGPFKRTTVKGQQATDEQLDNIKVVLGALFEAGATRDEMVMTSMAITQESTWVNLAGGDADSVGLLQQRPSQGWKGLRDRKAAALEFWGKLKTAEANAPGLEKTLLISAVQRPAAQNVRAYEQWQEESSKTVSAWDRAFGGSQSVVGTKQYEFRRGNIDGSPEDTWECLGRLADEVQYRRFVIDGVFYFLPDELLVGTGPRLVLTETSQGMLTPIDFDFDEGYDPQSATFSIRTGDWSCPVGTCIELDDMGPANGVWLVNKINGDLLQPHVQEIELVRPRAVLTEPPDDETLDPTTVSGGGRAPGATSTDQNSALPEDALATLSAAQQFIVQEAQSWLGVPYLYGGNSKAGIDCSGLTQKVYGALGIGIPRVAADQWRAQKISKDKGALKAGDQLFFNWPPEVPPGHTGIYIGGGKFIHAPHTGTNVQVTDLEDYFAQGAEWYGWARRWDG